MAGRAHKLVPGIMLPTREVFIWHICKGESERYELEQTELYIDGKSAKREAVGWPKRHDGGHDGGMMDRGTRR